MRVALCTFFGAQRHSHDIPAGRLAGPAGRTCGTRGGRAGGSQKVRRLERLGQDGLVVGGGFGEGGKDAAGPGHAARSSASSRPPSVRGTTVGTPPGRGLRGTSPIWLRASPRTRPWSGRGRRRGRRSRRGRRAAAGR